MVKKYYRHILFSMISLPVLFSTVYCQSSLVKTIHFKSKSYSIDSKYQKTLDLVARQLVSDTFSFLRIFGYADTKGSADYNDVLSGKRAMAVYDYLSSHAKFDTTKVYITWIGKSADAYDLHFLAAHIQQRCVDIWATFYTKSKVDKPPK
jgi:outer membrane protein OmpA-like peptidoglycan-associated protein